MQLYKFPAKLIRIAPNAVNALNGVVANTFDKPRNAFLDRQGRILAVVHQKRISDDELWLVVMDSALPRLKAHLEKMLMFSDAKIEQLPHQVTFDLQNQQDLDIHERSGGLRISEKPLSATVDEETFRRFRLQHGIALQDIDFNDEMLLNLNDDELVSYSKGCFLGQEIIARVHYKSRPPRKLAVCFEDEVPEGLRPTMTSVALDPASGRKRGFVFLDNKS